MAKTNNSDEISLDDALRDQDELELQAAALFGACDPDNCSYSKGYLKRQALFVCLTCNPKAEPLSQPAGVCLACSLRCHEGHVLVDIGTRRNFRCDCGNNKFSGNPCRLESEKDELNLQNVYNQNFTGVFCTCHKPSPDPEAREEADSDAMIQCIICEDWFHFKHCLDHLTTDIEYIDEDFEMICRECVKGLNFLENYAYLALGPIEKRNNDEDDGELSADDEGRPRKASQHKSQDEIEEAVRNGEINDTMELEEDSYKPCSAVSAGEFPANTFLDGKAVAWGDTLRDGLCRCETCKEVYGRLKVEYLLDPEDTMAHYEAQGIAKVKEEQKQAEASIDNFINNLGRVEQIELANDVNQLRERLKDYFQSHAQSGKVIDEDSVNDILAKLKDEKRRRLE